MLVGLIKIVAELKEEFEKRSGEALLMDNINNNAGGEGGNDEAIPSGHNFSRQINSLIWARQIGGKLKKVQTVAQGLLSDLKEHANFKDTAEQLGQQVREFEQEQFEAWRSDVAAILK